MYTTKPHRWFFNLCILESVVAIIALLRVPSEGGTLSIYRLVLIAVPFSLLLAGGYLSLHFPDSLEKIARPSFIILLAILSLLSGLALFLLRYVDPQRFLSIYERLSPLIGYVLILSLQAFLYLLYLHNGFHFEKLTSRQPVYFFALISFLILLGVFIFVWITRLGITPDPAYWGEPGIPLLGWQFIVALLGGVTILCIGPYLSNHKLDLILPISIYVLMVIVCLSVPVSILQNSFYMPFARPIMAPFPYSDSMYYDQMAQSVLVGYPYQGLIPTRPLYIAFLTLMHLLFGQDYSRIIVGQTLALAVIPVVLYSLGRKLHSRTAGVTIALFFIFRELTSLLVSSETRVTNTKMILVDLPTLLLILITCYLVFRWFEKNEGLYAFAAGGSFGLLLLLRTQSMLILPFVVLLALLVFGWRNRSFYVSVSLFFLGLVITVLPWLTHNYLLTGKFAFDADFQYRLLASQYAYTGNLASQNVNFAGKGLGQLLIEFAIKDPKFVFGFIANHFLATHVNGLLALPLIEPFNGLVAPINLYWMNWDGHLAWYNVSLLVLYLAVISFGMGAAWKRWRWPGLLPLAFSIGYAMATAIGRFSSWRYDFPADWIWYFYFGIGFAEIMSQVAVLMGGKTEIVFDLESKAHPANEISWPVSRGILLASMFALISASPWLIKNISLPRYPDQTPGALISKISLIEGTPAKSNYEKFMLQPDSFIQMGRLLYPRFLSKDGGISSGTPLPAYAIRDFPRMGFLLLNGTTTQFVFPVGEYPGDFPHGADVIVLGCRSKDYVTARLIAFPQLNLAYTSAPLFEPCSP